ncbi:MAG TPA: hypothetical protein VFL47_12175, partial [Flavisolibacter sp.]|nr:hypothetical protein [Flavisolibacter sp.]
PGFRLIKDYRTTGKTNEGVVALFRLNENGDDRFMQVLFAGEEGREFFTAKAPASGTADVPYRNLSTPVVICRQEGQAWKRPFVAVYEPFNGSNQSTVEKMENTDRAQPENFTALHVYNKNGSRQIILQSTKKETFQGKEGWQFAGTFGVISFDKNNLAYLYLGEGRLLSCGSFTIETATPAGAANLLVNGNRLHLTCNQETTITIRGASNRKVFVLEGQTKKQLPVVKTATGIAFTLPPTNSDIQLN